jgi:hypothetical protein
MFLREDRAEHTSDPKPKSDFSDFDFAAAIALDPRAEPQPDVPVPEWLRLVGVDDDYPPANARSVTGSPSTGLERPPGSLSTHQPSSRGSVK